MRKQFDADVTVFAQRRVLCGEREARQKRSNHEKRVMEPMDVYFKIAINPQSSGGEFTVSVTTSSILPGPISEAPFALHK